MRSGVVLIAILMALASCTPIKMVEPKPRDIGSAYQVNPTKAWNGLNRSTFGTIAEQWTLDGLLLNGMNFWHDIADGGVLYEERGVEFPTFQSDMRATEIQEFFVSSATKAGAENVEASNLRPAKFGTTDGFRFDFTYSTSEGLKMRGMVLAAVVDQKLQIIEYWGADAHYYGENAEEAEKIFSSVQLI